MLQVEGNIMSNLVITLCFVALLACAVSVSGAQYTISDNRPLRLGAVTPVKTHVPRYGLAEFDIELEGKFENAFDPDQVSVDGEFKAPDGKTISVPGFYYEDFTRELRDGNEVLSPKGTPGWRIRFAPAEVGNYTLVVMAKDSSGRQVRSRPVKFDCTHSDTPGFIRRSFVDSRYFAFDDGQGYLPVGANVCWGNGKGTFSYDEWLPRYGEAGCSYFRVWLGPGWVNFAMEHKGEPDLYGVGKIDLANAWRLDYVLDLAAKQGLYVMLCFDSYNELRKKVEEAYAYWEDTPQNAANGGPLKEPGEFWTNPKMLRLYRNKLRYLVARYGWNPHVMSWEFWNEVDIISPSAYKPDEVVRWHAEMSNYLRSIDPWKHLQTTSFASSAGKPEVDKLSQIDYTQTHAYGLPDGAPELTNWQKLKESYGKPHYVGEFGADAGGPDRKVDPDGILLHDGIWSAVCSGAAGTAMLWWWDNHIQPGNLYYHFAALSAFVKGVDFPKEAFKRIDDASFAFVNPAADLPYRDLMLSGPASWQPSTANHPTAVDISEGGVMTVHGEIAGILHGMVNHRDLHNPLTFEMNLPHPTKVRINVTAVSGYGGAHLVAELDGKRVLDKDMPDTNPQGKHATLDEYNNEYAVDVPAGEHTVKVENIGADWMLVNYILERAERKSRPDLRLYGLRGKNVSLIWVQNSLHNYKRIYVLGHGAETVPPAILSILSWPEGKYHVRFWDTYAGKETESLDVTVGKDGLKLELPEVAKDLALKVERR